MKNIISGTLISKVFIGVLLFLSGFGVAEAATIDTSATSTAGQLISLAMGLLYIAATVIAVILLVQGVLKLIANSKNPNDPKGSVKSIFLTFLAAAMLTSVYTTASSFVKTITGSDGFCFLEQQNMTGEVKLEQATSSACFNADNSEITKAMRDRLTSSGSDNWDRFKERINIFFSLVQVIGLYYFIKSLVLLKGAADGRDQGGYGKILIMMIFSSIAMDLSKAIEIIVETFSSLMT